MMLLVSGLTLQANPVRLRCESLVNPLGIDIEKPILSWQSDNEERNWRQSAYQILVASRADLLSSGNADLWDSGKQRSGESTGIGYAGRTLESRKRYYWTVRVWDAKGHVSEAAEPAWWEMGLLRKSDWSAKWIRWHNPDEPADESGVRWIWVQGQDFLKVAPGTEAVFHLDFDLSEIPRRTALFLIARGDWKVTVNGHNAGAKPHWNEFDRREIDGFLIQGKNSIDVTVKIPQPPQFGPSAAPPNSPQPGALAALLKITHQNGTIERIFTGDRWQARLQSETKWTPASVIGELSDQRLGSESLGGVPGPLPQPAALFRRAFTVQKRVRRARAYVTALGAYEMFINGQRVGHDLLTPGFTDFTKRVQYQTYDVTGLLENGRNAVGAIVGAGWFGSGMSWTAEHFKLVPATRFFAQIEIEYADGTHDALTTDKSWKITESPILHAEIYAGETYDARLEIPGWNKAGFDDRRWAPPVVCEPYGGTLSGQIDAPPRVVAALKPERVNALPDGSYVFDMGQNMVGWVALRMSGKAGTTVRLRFAEILNPDGTIYTTNLRNADATDTYTLRGGSEETFTPRFTFHGFRYVELSGYPGKPTLADVTAEVVSSLSGEPTASMTTSSELVNQMWKLGIWGQRGNFLSVPTDCPQRDERLGWMADAAVFWRTGSYNFDIAGFANKWMRDVDDAQLPNGAFTNVSPNIGVGDIEGAPGWGDAGVIVPWTTWLQYGNRAAIERNWEAMEGWMKFIQDANPDFIRKNKVGPNFADWLAPDTSTSKDLVDTAYWALIAEMMSQMARAIDKNDDATRYSSLYADIRTAFQKAYVKDDGTVGNGSQTSYVVALQMKLLPESLETAAVDKLVKDIQAHNGHLTTGFLGTPFLLFALADHGRTDVAYQLLLTDTYPSWGYMLKKGATTWWERWNGDTGDPAMNSYNHYAFGSVVGWVYQCVAGIDTAASGPGFHEITIHPRLNPRIHEAHGQYESAFGKISTDWSGTAQGPFSLKVSIPANTTAQVFLPAIPNAKVMDNGRIVRVRRQSGSYVASIGSGSYEFEEK
ncbi:MAG: family 78 glycoside hydrolase catalytic domain [Bryobacteraceae bacterium]